MYFQTFGGSALLHLLVGYPRLILVLGIAGTVAMLSSPQGPGRYVGTGHYLSQLDAAIESRPGDPAVEAQARRQAATAVELAPPEQVRAAVTHTLQQCGPGCTDLSTPIVIRDSALLEEAMTLYYLDQMASTARTTTPAGASTPAETTARR